MIDYMPENIKHNVADKNIGLSISTKTYTFLVSKGAIEALNCPWYLNILLSPNASRLYVQGSNTLEEGFFTVPVGIYVSGDATCRMRNRAYVDKLSKILKWIDGTVYKFKGYKDDMTGMLVFELETDGQDNCKED